MEETAAASSSLQEQAGSLVKAMSIFTLGNEPDTAPGRLPRHPQAITRKLAPPRAVLQ